MCGIAGILNVKGDPIPDLRWRLNVMNHLQRHRGPDDEGLFVHEKGHTGFAHRRLSIIDLETGRQPMSDGAGRTICYNGEIYNYKELRRELSSYPFKTASDTEVILAAYDFWGEECVSRLRGMFSFAIWDENSRSLFCARDRFGIKPFSYAVVGDVFLFASEARPCCRSSPKSGPI